MEVCVSDVRELADALLAFDDGVKLSLFTEEGNIFYTLQGTEKNLKKYVFGTFGSKDHPANLKDLENNKWKP